MSIQSTTLLALLICNINQHNLVNTAQFNEQSCFKVLYKCHLLVVGHTISGCDSVDSVVLDLFEMCAKPSITSTDVS